MIFPHDPIADYELLDCGDGEKLERFGPWVLRRPDPQAMWRPARPAEDWDAADLSFVRESDRGGRWDSRRGSEVPESWEIEHRLGAARARLRVRPTPFKHVGLFPEQSSNWAWTAQRLADQPERRDAAPDAPPPSAPGAPRAPVLNLFAYTGAATVLAAGAGAFVTHVDASKPAMRWARENAELSALPDDAVRWIEDDVPAFVAREHRRGRRYAGILLDPPPYGRGPRNEKWTFEEQVVPLLEGCRDLLRDGPAFVALSCYAVGTSPLAFHNMLDDLFVGGTVQAGELALPQTGRPGRSERLLPAGLCGRWWRDA